MSIRLPELGADPASPFPPVNTALRHPDGLLAWGGGLETSRLLAAYRHGCFPWFEEGQPILWWSPDPRLVLRPDDFHVSRSFAKALRRSDWTISADTRFGEVIRACARTPRAGQHGTWIVTAMIDAYEALHEAGHAHSVEVADARGDLVGGIYDIAIGRMFFGESMFSAATNGSKTALLGLCRHLQRQGALMIDCQVETAHLVSLGASIIDRGTFIRESRAACGQQPMAPWREFLGHETASSLLQSTT